MQADAALPSKFEGNIEELLEWQEEVEDNGDMVKPGLKKVL